jgi:hypothetical protein
MPNGDIEFARELAVEESNNELRLKKGIGILDAILLAIGFTTTNLQHIITPVAEGGIGVSLAGEGAVVASLVALGVSTFVIAGVVIYYVVQLINQGAKEVHELVEKQKALEEKQMIFFSRLIYLRHLIEHKRSMQLNDLLKRRLELDQEVANALASTVDAIYREEKAFFQVICQRNVHEESEEKAIQSHFSANKENYLPRIRQSLSHIYESRPPVPKSWKPELVGLLTGFVSFLGMSSGFIGTYYSVVSLAIGMASVSLAVPVLGWAVLGASLVFGLAIGLVVRHYTDKSIKRDEAMEIVRAQEETLNENLVKAHELEMRLLTDNVAYIEHKAPDMEKKASLPRSRSWSGTLFDRGRNLESVPVSPIQAESKTLTLR